MTELTPEKRAELRELIGESPDLPYRVSHGTHGNPSDGPTYVALEALWDGRWEEVATGDYASWNGMALDLAAAAVNALPSLLDAADERDRLATQAERVHEYGIMRAASMPDMSGRDSYTQIVGATFPTEGQARMAARRVPALRDAPTTICRRVAPGEWELA